jgi:predicted PurR-regulated permease PerM
MGRLRASRLANKSVIRKTAPRSKRFSRTMPASLGPTRATELPTEQPPAQDPTHRIARTLRATVIIAGAAILLWVFADAVLVVLLATLLAVTLRALGSELRRTTGLDITVSVIVMFVVLVTVFSGISWWIGPRLVEQTHQLWHQISGQAGMLQSRLHGAGFNPLQEGTSGLTQVVAMVASSTLSFLGGLLVVIFTGLYFAIAPAIYVGGVVRLLPSWYRERARSILIEMGTVLQGWLLGQLIDMVAVGMIVGGGLSLLGTPLALVLAVIAGLFTFIPYFGTIISAVPALLVGLTTGARQAIWILGLFLLAHGIEGYLINPFVQRRTVNLPPALTVVAMVVLTAAVGITGMLIATPLVAVMIVGITRIYVEDILGDRTGATSTYRAREVSGS